MEEKKIKFKNLSWALKTAIVMSYIVGAIYAMTFLIGFILGVMGY